MFDTTKERVSINHMFFSFPNEYLFIIVPMITGIISLFTSNENFARINNNDETAQLVENQNLLIDLYLLWFKTAFIVLLAFLITYRWSAIQKNRSYGFWIANGVSRLKFMIIVFLKTITMFALSAFLGLFVLSFPAGFNTGYDFKMIIFGLQLSNILVWVSIAIFFAEIINAPEMAALTILLVFITNSIFNTEKAYFLHYLLNSDSYLNNNWILAFFSATFFSIGLLGLSLYIHTNRNLEI